MASLTAGHKNKIHVRNLCNRELEMSDLSLKFDS
jgi:hypothetical protein